MTAHNKINFPDFEALKSKIDHLQTSTDIGRVIAACGTIIRVSGLAVNIGELCRLFNPGSEWELMAEVIGLDKEYALLTPLGSIHGVSNATRVVSSGHAQQVHVGDELLGKVLDGHGRLLSNKQWAGNQLVPLYADPPDPVKRNPIERPLATGIRSIDTLLTCGEGQRTGIFAAAGGGKSTLLGMLARGADADVNVIALIGERGREVNEFIQDVLGDSLSKSVVIVSTSDRPALERARASYVATSIAEYFRDQGKRVLLLMDSVTRFARALRDVGLAAGEPPTRRGFPPSVFSTLPQLLERSGNNDKGSITAYYTVLMEDEDTADPIAEEVRSILDGHIVLSRELAAKNHFPAIDIMSSTSRLMHKLVTSNQWKNAGQARSLLAKYSDIELLVQMGEYKPGHDAEADAAMAANKKLSKHLRQSFESLVTYKDAHLSLRQAIKGGK